MNDDFLWVEKYRPKTLADTILPPELAADLKEFISKGNIPNLILEGRAGVGKTTVAKAMCEELGCDYIVINGSLNGNIDTLRNEIFNFATAISMSGGRKYVILDEADYLNANSVQPALRNFMEQYSKNCGFILTCNYLNRIIEPLQSRCSIISFKIEKAQAGKLASQFMKRVEEILTKEKVTFQKEVLAKVILKHFPDWRRILNELQRYAARGTIDTGILTFIADESFRELLKHMKERNFTAVRRWVGERSEGDQGSVFRWLYDNASEHLDPSSIPLLVITLGRYQHYAAFSVDPEINLSSCLAELMVEMKWK